MDTRLLRNCPAYVLDRQTAPAMWLVETLWLFYATAAQTNNRFSLLEQVMGGGVGPPAHRHPLAIENFVVLEGVVVFRIDGRSVRAGPGTFLHIPRMKPHTFTVETAETWVLNFYAPAGNELNVMGLARPAEERRRPSMEEGPLPAGTDYIEITAQLYGSHPVAALPFGAKPSDALIDTPADAWAVGDTHAASAADAPTVEAFGVRWRVLADSRDTELDYDLLDALVPERAGTPRRVLGADEAIYVRAGIVSVEIDETSTEIGVGSFAYTPARSRCSWHAQTGGAHVLVFHIPGGFDRALANGRGEDALVQAWDEARRNPVSAATSVPHARSPAPTRGQSRHRVNPDEQAPWSPTC